MTFKERPKGGREQALGTSEGKNIPGRGCSKFKVSEAEVGPVCLRKSGEARADGVEGKEEKEGGVTTQTTPRCFLFSKCLLFRKMCMVPVGWPFRVDL